MAKFDLKKAILENKATFFSSLNEGQFSWMTQDTGQQIGSQDGNQIPVYMFDDKGKYYYENDYEGYGEFGGMDYYELLDKMNGGSGDRSRGIDLAFGKEKTGSEILFPALVTKPDKFNYKQHNFAVEAETDPNQSWLAPEEDDDDYIMGDREDDEEEDDMMEGLNEGKMYFHVLEDGGYGDIGHQGVYNTKEEAQNKANKLADMFPSSSFYVEASDSKDEPYNVTMEENKEVKPTTKMKKSELKDKIKEMILKEMESNNMEDAPENEVDFLAELEGMLSEAEGETITTEEAREYAESWEEDFILDDFNKAFNNQEKVTKPEFVNFFEDYMDDMSEIKYIQAAWRKLSSGEGLYEAEDTEEVTDDVTVDDTETIDTTTTTEVNPDVKAVQDALTQAQAAAQKLGDAKLTDQIGNTITFFTRAHIVEKGAVAEADEMEEETLYESMFPLLKKISK